MSNNELAEDFSEIDDDLLRAVVDELDKQDREEARKKNGSGHSLKALMALKKKDIEIDVLKERHEQELEQAVKGRDFDISRGRGSKFHTIQLQIDRFCPHHPCINHQGNR